MVTGNVFQEVVLVMITGNVFQAVIDLNKNLIAILLARQTGFNREGPVERVEVKEDFRIVN